MDKALLKILSTSVAGRYARAIFSCAEQQNILTAVGQDLEKLDHLWQANPQVWQGFASGVLKRQQKMMLWQLVGEKLQLQPLVVHFCHVLSQAKRLHLWSAIFQAYQLLSDASQGRRQVVVQTALELSAEERIELAQVLQKLWSAQLIFTFLVVPDLKAGVIIQSHSLRLDASFDTYLAALSNFLKGDL